MIVFGLGFILGICLGSFVLCIAARSLTKETYWGRSYCDRCKHTLAWYDLFPILSLLLLKGRCRYCHKKVSAQTLLVEILIGLLIGLLFFIYLPYDFYLKPWTSLNNVVVDLILKTFAICVFVAVFITDIRAGLIPDRITYPSVKLVFGYFIAASIYKISLLYILLRNDPLGKFFLSDKSDYFIRHAYYLIEPVLFSLFGATLMAIFFGSLIFVTRGRGMGGGDLKLGFLMGLLLGFPLILLAVLLAFLLGSIVGVFLLLIKRKNFGQTIPFGPFLSIGGIITIYWGNQILEWYVHTFNVTGLWF